VKKALLITTFGLLGYLSLISLVDDAYAWQEVSVAKVISLGCYPGENVCFFVINKDHHITTETTQCKKRYFGWDSSGPNAQQFYDLARNAYERNTEINVRIRYSEYQCFNTSQGPYMQLIFLVLE
jgi:hypothetical protein